MRSYAWVQATGLQSANSEGRMFEKGLCQVANDIAAKTTTERRCRT